MIRWNPNKTFEDRVVADVGNIQYYLNDAKVNVEQLINRTGNKSTGTAGNLIFFINAVRSLILAGVYLFDESPRRSDKTKS